jgi:hypothetical protein
MTRCHGPSRGFLCERLVCDLINLGLKSRPVFEYSVKIQCSENLLLWEFKAGMFPRTRLVFEFQFGLIHSSDIYGRFVDCILSHAGVNEIYLFW